MWRGRGTTGKINEFRNREERLFLVRENCKEIAIERGWKIDIW